METKIALLAYLNILPGFEKEVKEATITMAEEAIKKQAENSS